MLAVFFLFLCVSASTQGTPSIIIIGAGPAGIAAASKLFENSFTNLLILEAENRIGGRINSVKLGEKYVDLGAEYCHGQKGNIVYELVKDLNVLAPISSHFKPALYYSNGSRLQDSFTEELQAIILGYDDFETNSNFSGRSVGEVFTSRYNATIMKKYEGDAEKIKLLKEALRLAEKVSLMIDGAFSWLETSPVKHYVRSEGHQLLVWQGLGYRTILQVLMGEFPDQKSPIREKIRLNSPITQIRYHNSSKIVVTTTNGSYEADHVIFTPSVGVLKREKDTLFQPPLPEQKLQAIEALGIAGVMKIVLHFENEWWGDQDSIFTFLWGEEDLGNLMGELKWVQSVALVAKVPGNPGVLVAWVTGGLIPEMEKMSEDDLLKGCVFLLEKFLGRDYNITTPDKILKSTWHTNGHFRGTYSYERAGFEGATRYQSLLAAPLESPEGKPAILFAGEASNPVHYSTVHGAIESGFREASRLIKLYRKN
ncbi:lysine-specific histone demethylase 1A [Tribolium castaneum]|uniref:lysine-specific histone demethylase 1A n=1 Tax=Tribolium castaneum TaxID=7070 RepID=UPI0030FE0CD3